ncbi:hypothetical protein LRP31_34380 (plasmid) [Mesorhizobium mediterraneum]|uniref:hypothetical protein n=1 Tax=Mesorhizobium TaxID=68287 RepID=UPI0013050E3A|nr:MULTISPECIES: hypothetical protein [Mesorhizobium]WIW57185.1 hypothetical protein LRP31_34380 [Mesorhizobium mediterraneum]
MTSTINLYSGQLGQQFWWVGLRDNVDAYTQVTPSHMRYAICALQYLRRSI